MVVGTLGDDAADLIARKLQFRGLLETFAGLYRHRFRTDDFTDLESLCKELDNVNNERTHLVHSFWTPGSTADKLGRFRKAVQRRGPKVWDENVSEADVLKFAQRADAAYSRLIGFIADRVLQRINDVLPKR